MNYKINISKDWDWFLAEVIWQNNLYAYWDTYEEAKKELLLVLEMMIDYHIELVEKEKSIRNNILSLNDLENAI